MLGAQGIKTYLTFFSLIFIAAAPVRAGHIWWVDNDRSQALAPGNPSSRNAGGEGSRTRPFKTIQEGIDASGDGDTVMVADGTYTGDGNRNINFRGKRITLRSEKGPEHCVIDGQGSGRSFLFWRGESRSSRLAGFTITHGRIQYGAGILCKNSSSPEISNCVIIGNHAIIKGGGICCRDGSNPKIHQCLIMNNDGGGIGCFDGSSPKIHQCLVTDNDNRRGGGGIYIKDAGQPEIFHCVITNNVSGSAGGGIYCVDTPSPRIIQCLIADNTSSREGGGIYLWNSSPIISGCRISTNSASHGGGIYVSHAIGLTVVSHCEISENKGLYGGGGILCRGCHLRVTDCLIAGNAAEEGEISGGGGISCRNEGHLEIYDSTIADNISSFYGGGIDCFDNRSADIFGCIIAGNTAKYGGGVHCYDNSSPFLRNCIITGNRATGFGAGFYCVDGYAEISGCTFADNDIADIRTQRCTTTVTNSIFWNREPPTEKKIFLWGTNDLSISFSDLQGGAEAVYTWPASTVNWGPGMIDADPLFADPFSLLSDFHLTAGSPCIDTGDPDFRPEPGETDIDGDPRILKDRVDMGADEYK
jgi:parallel beta-helix repeat protein